MRREHWGSLALDLALETAPLEDILRAYDLTAAEFHETEKNVAFQNELRLVRERIESMGDNGGFILRARAIAEATLPTMMNLIQSSDTEPAVKASIFKTLTELARLDFKSDPNPPKSATAAGPTFQINFSNMPAPDSFVTIEQANDKLLPDSNRH